MELSEQLAAWSSLVYNWSAAPKYKGIICQQHQSDLDRYAAVIRELKPAWLLQTGIYWGGTSAFLADAMAEHGGRSMFVDVDLGPCQIREEDLPSTRITRASATDPDFFEEFVDFANSAQGLVSLDDNHSCEQVVAELGIFAEYASYLVVEDTILDAAVGTIYQPSNPKQALDAWLPSHPEFTVDPDPEPTQHVGGWLRRVQ